MKAMILAAGLGTRLRPLTDARPKALLPIAGKPLIVWNLLLLRNHGITEVIINLHHLGNLIEESLGDGTRYGLHISYSKEQTLLGTGGGIKQAESFFEGKPFFVLNGDTVLDLDCGALMRFHSAGGSLATLVLREDPEVEQWGVVEVHPRQEVISINGRGHTSSPLGGRRQKRMFAGAHVIHPRLLLDVPRGRESSIIDAYVRALECGETIRGYDMAGYWSDVGTPERYTQVQRDAEAGLAFLSARERLSKG
jgi:NDP-sugar pyrophosphorylase family protein